MGNLIERIALNPAIKTAATAGVGLAALGASHVVDLLVADPSLQRQPVEYAAATLVAYALHNYLSSVRQTSTVRHATNSAARAAAVAALSATAPAIVPSVPEVK